MRLSAKRIATRNTHGTGCTLSSAIAAGLAKGRDLITACQDAKAYVTAAIAHADELRVGQSRTRPRAAASFPRVVVRPMNDQCTPLARLLPWRGRVDRRAATLGVVKRTQRRGGAGTGSLTPPRLASRYARRSPTLQGRVRGRNASPISLAGRTHDHTPHFVARAGLR